MRPYATAYICRRVCGVCVDERGSAEDHGGEAEQEAHGFAEHQRAAGTNISDVRY